MEFFKSINIQVRYYFVSWMSAAPKRNVSVWSCLYGQGGLVLGADPKHLTGGP